jgi:ABC-type Zn2+ transport system substrate-binding protein/surface adhesin
MELMQQLNLQQHMLRMIRMHVDGTKASIETEKRVLDSLIKKDQKRESKYNKKRKELEQELAELNDAIGRVTLQILEKEFAVIAEREIQGLLTIAHIDTNILRLHQVV